MNRCLGFASCFAALLLFSGCFPTSQSSSSSNSTVEVAEVEFPDGDPSVPAELGGPGFTGEGWQTSEPASMGDPRAVKGGSLRTNIPAWPDNLRIHGGNSNTWLNYLVTDLCYMSLVSVDSQTLEFVPGLASHWKISEDQMKFSFRINPKARWSDGKPVVSDDVIATYRLLNDDTLQDPMAKESICGKMKEPVALSKYMFEVECKKKHWQNFLLILGMVIQPAHEIADLKGEDYLDKYNFSYTAVNGPYFVRPQDIKTDESLTLTRRKDWWAAGMPQFKGAYNIDRIRFSVIRDDKLAYDKAVKGELDFYPVFTAQRWVEELPKVEAVQKNHLVRRKVFTRFPKSIQGQAINMRKEPLNDVRVRKALAHLFDRRTMIEKFAFNEYEPLTSYYPGGPSENRENQIVEYDPQKAAELLAEAGWKERGPDGILVKDGKKFSATMIYRQEGLEKYYTVWQEACKQAGIELKLQLLDGATQWSNMQDRKFEIGSAAWGATLYPNPLTLWHSSIADKAGANNFVGFKNEEVDALIDQYDSEFEQSKRTEILQKIDGIVFNEHPYVLAWYLPCERFIYWNKFGMPETVLNKYDEYEDALSLWWVDPEKEKKLKEAIKSGATLEEQAIEVKPWASEGSDNH